MATFRKIVHEASNPSERDEIVEALRAENNQLKEKLQQLQADLSNSRVSSFGSGASFETGPQWVRAELDCPGDTAWYLFFGQRRSKYRKVIVYDPSHSRLEPIWRSDMKDSQGIYCRFPSRLGRIVYVFIECATTAAPRKFRVSSKKETPLGFSPYCKIHLKRLSWGTRAKIWMGRIKWLYILGDSEWRANSPFDQRLEK